MCGGVPLRVEKKKWIKLRRIDGWPKIAAMLSQHTSVAA
jgi:hypothetical protein